MPRQLLHDHDYRCYRCNRGFARLEHLQRHERSHTKEKPYRCNLCPMAFTRKDLLTRHERLRHQALAADPDPTNTNTGPKYHQITYEFSAELQRRPQHEGESFLVTSRHQATNLDSNVAVNPNSAAVDVLPYADADPAMTFDPEDYFSDPALISFDNDLTYSMSSAAGEFTFFSKDDDGASDLPPPLDLAALQLPVDTASASSHRAQSNCDSYLIQTTSSITRPGTGCDFPSLIQSSPPYSNAPTPDTPANNFRLLQLKLPSSFTLGKGHDKTYISADCYHRVLVKLEQSQIFLETSFSLPSRHILSRLFGAYFAFFHPHFPFLHKTTFEPSKLHVELFLAIAAIGARYTQELNLSTMLFTASRSLVSERIRKRRNWRQQAQQSTTVGAASSATNVTESLLKCDGLLGCNHDDCSQYNYEKNHSSFKKTWQSVIQIINTLVLMLAITTWSESRHFAENLPIRNALDCLIHEEEVFEAQLLDAESWQEWIFLEHFKRTLFAVFCFYNIHTILFDLPPIILVKDIQLRLPCPVEEWMAETEEIWKIESSKRKNDLPEFRQKFQNLFNVEASARCKSFSLRVIDLDAATTITSFGACALMHGLIQRLWLARNADPSVFSGTCGTLSEHQIKLFEAALNSFEREWRQSEEFSLDPLSPHGPNAFNSMALMRLVYIRLHINLGRLRGLANWDSNAIAQYLYAIPLPQRSGRVTKAVLNCAEALSIPISLGLNFVADLQVRFWSVQQALCSLECAILFSKWHQMIAISSIPALKLTSDEKHLLNLTLHLVSEADYSVSSEDGTIKQNTLGARVIRLWARLYRSKSIWERVDLIRDSLIIYAGLLDST